MVTTRIAFVALAIGLPAGYAQAESLRCQGGIAAEGDSRLSVIYKCGQPNLADTYCAPVFYGPTRYPVPEAFASAYVPCQTVEQWVYERGPGNLVATVRISSGIVQSITYGRVPQ